MAAELSDANRANVDALREAVKDELTPYYDTDFNLLRWLKGHNDDLKEIVPKLRNHLIFRRSHWKLDEIADTPRDHPIHAHWREGLTRLSGKTPHAYVNIEQTGANDYWGLLQTWPMNEVMRARVHDLECMLRVVMEEEARTGKQASILYIMDLGGLRFDRRLPSMLTGALSAISAFMAEHYVELIHSFVLVNVPTFISAIWSIAKPLLPERTKNKVKILGGNWKTEILQHADGDALPTFWNEPSETTFKASLERAVPFAETEYYRGGPIADATPLEIGAGRRACVSARVERGQRLKWTFTTDGHFAYGVYRVPDDALECDDPTQMRPVYPRFNKVPGPTHVPLEDYIDCEESGTYKLWFSNEHAWMHTLHVRHRIRVENV